MAEFVVLGAGIVGISTALALNERGHSVTVLDRREPGLETSYGNAGIIQREAAEPYQITHHLPTLIRYGLGRTNDIVYHWRDLPRLLPALLSYYRYSSPASHAAISRLYNQLIVHATADHQPLVEAAGADNLIRRNGFFGLCRTQKDYDSKALEAEHLKATYDVPVRMIDGAELRAEEPVLKADLTGAVHWSDSWSTSDPLALTQSYARLLEKRGGRIVKGDAQSLVQQGSGWSVQTEEGAISADNAVVALGPWAPDLLTELGYQIKMIWKRGYHGHFDLPAPINRPLHDFANGIVMAPVGGGLRIATGAELVRRDGAENFKQLHHGIVSAKQLIEVGREKADRRWFGHRPCLPDMLPMVGEAPRHKGLWFNFGHGHQGLTLGPTTARLLADMVEGQSEPWTAQLAPGNRAILS